MNAKEGSLNETDSKSKSVVAPQPVAATTSRAGVLGWFGSSSSVNSATGIVGEPPAIDEAKPRVEEVTVDRSQSKCSIRKKEEALLERERQVESREKELEERKLGLDQREKELEDRCRGLEEETERKLEEVARRERELEARRGEFEREKEKWEASIHPETIWKSEMENLKKEMSVELSTERKKAEERELELETRVMKKVTELLDEQKSGWRKKWDASLKPLTRKATSSSTLDTD